MRTFRQSGRRSLIHVLLAVGVLLGAGCAGTGIGAATGTDVYERAASVNESGGTQSIWMWNRTAFPIWGEMHQQKGENVSEHYVTKVDPLLTGKSASSQLSLGDVGLVYTWGRWCYQGSWWNLPRQVYGRNALTRPYGYTEFNLAPSVSDHGVLVMLANDELYGLIETPGDSGCGTP